MNPRLYHRPSLCLHIIFFFYCYGDHRDLHSFPTRRSSDLLRTLHSAHHDEHADASMATALLDDPTGYGRIIRDEQGQFVDRKSTRLNSSHMSISYAVFCLKKKKKKNTDDLTKRNFFRV